MADRSLARTTNLLAILAACRSAPPTVVPNDNQVAGTVWRGDTLVFAIEARVAAWTPDPTADSAVTVHAFAAPDHVPRVPGPLLRVTAGATVEIQVANLLNDSALVVHGLRPGTGGDDTVRVAAGTSRTVWFTAAVPGTYLYWGSTTGDRMVRTERREGALAGAIVVDPAGVAPDAGERIFVISVVDITPDTTKPPPREDVFELALNGRSWPATERLVHVVGDTVRWRLLNATATPHPMHLHGFHFTTIAKGDGRQDSTYAAGEERQAVTEYLPDGGGTARIRWVPTRAGSWLFHCHIVDHVVPFPARSDSARARSGLGAHGRAAHVSVTGASPATAHRSSCHRAHSCPSDHATYRWRGLLCVKPTAYERNSSFRKRVVYAGRTYYCKR